MATRVTCSRCGRVFQKDDFEIHSCDSETTGLKEVQASSYTLAKGDSGRTAISANALDGTVYKITIAERRPIAVSPGAESPDMKIGVSDGVTVERWRALRRYLRQNWGALPIGTFMILLIGAAVVLSLGAGEIANTLAIYAFYALVTGVVLQVASYALLPHTAPNDSPVAAPSETTKPRTNRGRPLLISALAVLVLVSALAGYVASPGVLGGHSQPQTTTITTAAQTETSTVTTTVLILPPGLLAYPYNLTAIAEALAKNGTVTFWYPTGTDLGSMVTTIVQSCTSYGGCQTAAGSIVGRNTYRITVSVSTGGKNG